MTWPASLYTGSYQVYHTAGFLHRSREGVCQEADDDTQTELLIETSKLLAEIKTALARLLEVTEKAAAAEGGKVQALVYHSQVVPAMEALRHLWTSWK